MGQYLTCLLLFFFPKCSPLKKIRKSKSILTPRPSPLSIVRLEDLRQGLVGLWPNSPAPNGLLAASRFYPIRSFRFFFLCLRPGSRVAYACACVVRVNQLLLNHRLRADVRPKRIIKYAFTNVDHYSPWLVLLKEYFLEKISAVQVPDLQLTYTCGRGLFGFVCPHPPPPSTQSRSAK